jgi:NADP-dependent 3-hydroxy acid dehydrogenase YdfG
VVRVACYVDAGGSVIKPDVVVVTGAGSGIGRATALAFANKGARIAACDVDQARLDALAYDLGDRALVIRKVDVADRAQMSAFADAVHALVPAADVIVNNAGVAVGGTFLEISLDDWEWLLGINLKGVVHGCHFFIPKMVERKAGGHVINISSVLGIFPAPRVTAYVASKFAVLGMSQSLRAELAEHKIGVTAICPGMINTAIVADSRVHGVVAQRREKVKAAFIKSGAPPEAVAAVILDAVKTNPAVRTVGRDAAVISALARFAPAIGARLGSTLSRRFGGTG